MQCMCAFVYPAFFIGFYLTATCTVRIYFWKKTTSSISFYNKCRINHISTPLSKQGNWSAGMEMGRGKRYFLLIHVSRGKRIVVLFLGELWKSNQPTFTASYLLISSLHSLFSSRPLYFPTLYQMSVELERAVLTTNSRVWVPIGADENRFPSFSGTGYAIFPAYKVMSHCFILFFVLFVRLQLYEVFFLLRWMAGPLYYSRVVQCRQDINKCHQSFLIMEIEYAFSYPSYRQQNKTV